MEALQQLHGGTRTRVDRSSWPPAQTKKLATVQFLMTSAELYIDSMDTIDVKDNDLIRSACIEDTTFADPVPKLYAKPKARKCCRRETSQIVIPKLLKALVLNKEQILYEAHLNPVKAQAFVSHKKTRGTKQFPTETLTTSIQWCIVLTIKTASDALEVPLSL